MKYRLSKPSVMPRCPFQCQFSALILILHNFLSIESVDRSLLLDILSSLEVQGANLSCCLVSLAGFFFICQTSKQWVARVQSLDFFFIYTHSLGDNIQIHGFKYLLYADNSQIYIFSLDLFPKYQTHLSNCLPDSYTWMC